MESCSNFPGNTSSGSPDAETGMRESEIGDSSLMILFGVGDPEGDGNLRLRDPASRVRILPSSSFFWGLEAGC